jgi:phospholipid N-methyltransferase
MNQDPSPALFNDEFEFAALREAVNYRRALLREFGPNLKGRVIEVGAGIGQFTEMIVHAAATEHLLAVEPDSAFCKQLRINLPRQPLIEGTVENVPTGTPWDAIVSINVLEHIPNDQIELVRYHELLKDRQGTINLFVPARQEIYAPIDKAFGHFRRYSKAELTGKLEKAGFKISRLRYFNCAGYFGWWLTFCLLKKRKFDVASVRLFDRGIFPLVYWFESRILAPPFGQSLLAVGKAA